MNAHLPRMEIDDRSRLMIAGFREEAVELTKCGAYYRGILAQRIGFLPRHLGVIMDGNRRYSRDRGLGSVLAGHQVGAHRLLQVTSWAFSCGIENLTAWALFDDNLKRGPQELEPLSNMMAQYIREMITGDAPFPISNMRFHAVGDRSMFPHYLNEIIVEAETTTSRNTKFNLQIAIGYGGRSEVTRAANRAIKSKMALEGLVLEEAVERL